MGRILNKILDLLEPKCDLCWTPGTKQTPLFSDGVGICAHEKCWLVGMKGDKVKEINTQVIINRRIDKCLKK